MSNEVKGQPKALCPHLPRMRTAMGWEWQAMELRLLINSHCPIIRVESSEEDRFAVMLWCVAADIGVALCLWSATEGLSRAGGTALYNCDQPEQALANMATTQGDAVFLLKDLCVIARTTRSAGFCAIWRTDFAPRRSIVLLAATIELPKELAADAAEFQLGLPSAER